jgi:hypothetical protein
MALDQGQVYPEHGKRLEEASVPERTCGNCIEAEVGRQPVGDAAGLGVVPAVEHRGGAGAEARLGHVLEAGRVEDLHDPRRRSPSLDLLPTRVHVANRQAEARANGIGGVEQRPAGEVSKRGQGLLRG